jgi:hypothetical protein
MGAVDQTLSLIFQFAISGIIDLFLGKIESLGYIVIPLRSVVSKEIFGPIISILFLLDVRAVPVPLPNVNFVRRPAFTLTRIE